MHTAEINAPTVACSQIPFAATPLVLVDAMEDMLASLKRIAKRHVASAKKRKPEMKQVMKRMDRRNVSKIKFILRNCGLSQRFRFFVYFLPII